MPEIPQQETDGLDIGINMSTAVECLMTDSHRKEEKAKTVLRHVIHRSKSPNSVERQIAALMRWSTSPAEDRRLLELHPYLDIVEEATPIALDDPRQLREREVLNDLAAEQFTIDLTPRYFQKQSEVEKWINDTVDILQLQWRNVQQGQSAVLLFGMMYAIRNLLNGTTQWFSRAPLEKRESRVVFSTVTFIRRNTNLALLSRLVMDNDTERALQKLIKLNIQTYRIPQSPCFPKLPQFAKEIERARDEMKDLRETMSMRDALPRLAAQFTSVGADIYQSESCVVVPPAPVCVVQVQPEGQSALSYTISPQDPWPLLETHLGAMDSWAHDTNAKQWGEDGHTFSRRGTTSCRIDGDGRLFLFESDDRFVPISAETETAKIMNRAALVFDRRLRETWDAAPDLFQRLRDYGSLIIVEDERCRFLLIPSVHVAEVAALAGGTVDASMTEPLLKRSGIDVIGQWSCIRLAAPHKEELVDEPQEVIAEEEDEGAEEEVESDANRLARRAIRQYVGRRRIPHLEWIVDQLRYLGTVRRIHSETGSSHGSIYLVRPDGKETRASLAPSIEGTRSLRFTTLYQILRALQVPLEEFATYCLRD